MRRAPSRTGARGSRSGGFALLVVLLVLIALLVLSAPFLLMARNADRASGDLADRAEARLALDAGARHARLLLGASHPALDPTPYADDLEEIAVDNAFDPAFYDATDEGGVMWDVEREDVAGKIDLDSAPPQVIANLAGASTRFVRAIVAEDMELPVASLAGFDPTGVVWTDGELVRYTEVDGTTIVKPVRGVLGPPVPSEWRGGPRPPSGHDAGAPVLDQRAFAPALWRVASPDGDVRTLGTVDRLRETGVHALAAALGATEPDGRAVAELPEAWIRPMRLHGTVYGGVRGGPAWQRPARLARKVVGGEDGILRIDPVRWVNPGSTVQVSDGRTSEVAIVQQVTRGGEVVLDRVLVNDYEAWRTVVRVLARRPVNLNTADRAVLEALFANLQVAGRNSRITRDEARTLARVVVASRPLEGFEDFLRRVVLPAAGIEPLPADAPVVPTELAALSPGAGLIDADDALALYMNGLNANDVGLLYSTMPYAFTSRDVYDLEVRATVGAPSGVERFSRVRRTTELVVPQRQLLALWARQEDFDESTRLDLESPWWASGPSATSRWDGGAVPPSRLWANLGTAEGKVYLPGVTDPSAFQGRDTPPTAEHVFASREETGWIQLWPSRVAEASQRLQGRVLHFDHETRDPEGRYLPDEVVGLATDDAMVGWTAANALLCRPLALSMWIEPRSHADATLFDLGGTSHDMDRVSLLLEGGDLVLRVIAAGGDHAATTTTEWGEARFALAPGPGPGLPLDTWSHVEVDVRGDRPDQIHMLVNGLAHGVRRPGLTRLAAGIGQNDATIPVESTEGFPPRCTVRIGNELVEAEVAGNGQLLAAHQLTGEWAGWGGRIAREEYTSLSYPGSSNVDAPAHLATIATAHPAGTPVELYGYSLPVLTDVPSGFSRLAAPLGPFRVAEVIECQGGQQPFGDEIFAGWVDCGSGMEGTSSTVNALRLVSADDPDRPQSDFMPAFQPQGGYAVLMQSVFRVRNTTNNEQIVETNAGTPIGGVEIIQYGPPNGDLLPIVHRGVSSNELPNLGSLTQDQGVLMGEQPRAFVAQWTPGVYYEVNNQPYYLLGQREFHLYVFPISLAVPEAGSVNAFLAAKAGESQFAQITETQAAELTEWARYDWYQEATRQLVRDDPAALEDVHEAITHWVGLRDVTGQGQPGGPSPGSAPPPPSAPSAPASAPSPPRAPPPPAAAHPQSYSSQWDPRVGESESPREQYPFSEAVASHLQFRGVLGTYSHAHVQGTLVLPVFAAALSSVDSGRPGRMDAAFLVDSCPTHPGWPVRIHRAHAPGVGAGVTDWSQDISSGLPVPAPQGSPDGLVAQGTWLQNKIFVALQEASPQPIVAGSCANGVGICPECSNNTLGPADARETARLVCFPSGELPRIVARTTIGGGYDGAQSGPVPSALVDEVVFGDARFGRGAPGTNADALAGASLVLDADLSDTDVDLKVRPKEARTAQRVFGTNHEFLTETPDDAGLLRIGEEIVAYVARDPATGDVTLANAGRGLLGTTAQPHHATEPVTFLEQRPVTFLANAVGETDGSLVVANLDEFPEEGTVLVGSELVHYTRRWQNALEMPRASSVPGAMDEKGAGLFRGRFGTTAAGHAAGDPVILFPFRYWDRWQRRADAPELAYHALSIDQPSAFWESCFFVAEDATASRIGVLQRSDPDAPWDADPEADERLALHEQGDLEGRPIPILRQSDRIDWRVFVEYAPGAFDLATGLPHGWKETPRLTRFGAFYFGPGMVLAAVER